MSHKRPSKYRIQCRRAERRRVRDALKTAEVLRSLGLGDWHPYRGYYKTSLLDGILTRSAPF